MTEDDSVPVDVKFYSIIGKSDPLKGTFGATLPIGGVTYGFSFMLIPYM